MRKFICNFVNCRRIVLIKVKSVFGPLERDRSFVMLLLGFSFNDERKTVAILCQFKSD